LARSRFATRLRKGISSCSRKVTFSVTPF
jgi:hypothetical protein